MIIAQISDTHIALGEPDADQRLADLDLTIAAINELAPLPDAIVHTGDIAHNGRHEEYALAAVALAKARTPVYVLAGNKDDRANLRAAFIRGGYLAPDFDFVQYAVDRYPVRLIALDTQSFGNKGGFCRRRIEHLTRLIQADTTRPIAVFTHHPPFLVTEGADPFHFENRGAMSMLSNVLGRSRRVVAIFSGHVHRAASGDVDGIPAMVMTATATTLRHGQYPAALRSLPVYQVHRFDSCLGFATETRIASRGSAVPTA